MLAFSGGNLFIGNWFQVWHGETEHTFCYYPMWVHTEVVETFFLQKFVKWVTQTSHIKNGIRTLKNQYFSPQNILMLLLLSALKPPAYTWEAAE